MSELTRQALAAGSTKLAWDVLGRLLGFLLSILLARSLGASGFGSYAVYWYGAFMIAQLTDIGLHLVSLRAMSSSHASRVLASAVAAKLTLTGIVAAGAFVYSSSRLLLLLLAAQLLGSWVELFGVALRSRGLLGREGALLALLRAGWILAAAWTVTRGESTEKLALGLAIASLVVLLLALAAAAATIRDWGRVSLTGTATLLREAVPLATTGVITLVYLRADLFIVSALRGSYEAGVFQGAFRLFEATFVLSGGLAAGTFPLLASRFGRSDFASLARLLLAWSLALALPLVTVLTLFAETLTVAFYGEGFREAAKPLAYLGIALLAVFVNASTTHVLIAAHRMRRLVAAIAVRLAVGVAFDVMLVPSYGATGAAIAVLIAELSLTIVSSSLMADLVLFPAKPNTLETQELSSCS
ncbi:MAG TPA: polysaccharide biosynthesis C-terminal domain-containing protein [Vicinamibacteria bacterium]|nr:polysaccharide biosynthesis C-terminal domain-containing protein [Vicinamibacteria bacterium]